MPKSELRTEVDGRVLKLTNLEKVLYPETGWTKGEVVNYYLHVADTLLPHLRAKAMTRVRFPNGTAPDASSFYEKNLPPGCPDWVSRLTVKASDGEIQYLVADETATLVYLANLAALEMHVPQWHADPDGRRDTDTPLPLTDPGPGSDTVVVDLDPGEGLSPKTLARAAMLTGGLMATDGLQPLIKTSGSKGLQLYAAIQPTPGRACVAYVQDLGRRLHRHEPDLFVPTVTVAERPGKVYVDHNQNLTGRNTIAPYSLRGKNPYPNVSTPLEWDEVAAVESAEDLRFTPDAVLARIADHGDLFADLLDPDDPPRLPAVSDTATS
ncbi:DNA polymerase domain-containing protein [Mariniluteicoccus flavus]